MPCSSPRASCGRRRCARRGNKAFRKDQLAICGLPLHMEQDYAGVVPAACCLFWPSTEAAKNRQLSDRRRVHEPVMQLGIHTTFQPHDRTLQIRHHVVLQVDQLAPSPRVADHHRSNALLPSAAETLIAALKKLPALTDLSFRGVDICEGNLRELGGSFLGRLQKLALHVNEQLGDKGVSAIVDMIHASWGQRGCKLQELDLVFNSITSAGAHKISELTTCSPRLRCLDLDLNHIADGITPKALQGCANSLRKLNANKCELGPRGIASLLAPDFRALTTLNVSNNGLGDLGATTVARFLLRHGGRTLEELRINQNGIKEAGALELAKGLAGSYALLSINVNENPFGPCGTAALLDALATVPTEPMDNIDFSDCNAGDHGAEAVGRLIMRRGCRCVNLDSNSIKVRGAKAIADSIGSSAAMVSVLRMFNNTLGDEGITYLMNQIARKSESVCVLSVDLCGIGVKGAMAVKQAMEVQGTMRVMFAYSRGVDDMNAKVILNEVAKARRGEGYAELTMLEPGD